jgi:molecular chaperone DnaK
VAHLAEDIGIQTEDGYTVLIRKGTELTGHLVLTEVFSTAAEYQRSVKLKVVAINPDADRAWRILGRLELAGLNPAPRGVPRIRLRLAVTASGLVEAGVHELGTGNFQTMACSPVAVDGEQTESERASARDA